MQFNANINRAGFVPPPALTGPAAPPDVQINPANVGTPPPAAPPAGDINLAASVSQAATTGPNVDIDSIDLGPVATATKPAAAPAAAPAKATFGPDDFMPAPFTLLPNGEHAPNNADNYATLPAAAKLAALVGGEVVEIPQVGVSAPSYGVKVGDGVLNAGQAIKYLQNYGTDQGLQYVNRDLAGGAKDAQTESAATGQPPPAFAVVLTTTQAVTQSTQAIAADADRAKAKAAAVRPELNVTPDMVSSPTFGAADFVKKPVITDFNTGATTPLNPDMFATLAGASKLAALLGGEVVSIPQPQGYSDPCYGVKVGDSTLNAGENIKYLQGYGLEAGLGYIHQQVTADSANTKAAAAFGIVTTYPVVLDAAQSVQNAAYAIMDDKKAAAVAAAPPLAESAALLANPSFGKADFVANPTVTDPYGGVTSLNSAVYATLTGAAKLAALLGGEVVDDSGSYGLYQLSDRSYGVKVGDSVLTAGLAIQYIQNYGMEAGLAYIKRDLAEDATDHQAAVQAGTAYNNPLVLSAEQARQLVTTAAAATGKT